MANSSSLSNVVTNLVRAQMGASIPASTLDEELDRRVAELILQEARKKEATFNRTGSYSPQIPGNAVKTNKRFLSSIIKSTDEHNKAILKVQADAAQEVKQQRDLEERRERLKRAEEAVSARLGGSNSPWSGRDDDRGRRRRSVSQERHDRHIGASRPDRKRDRSRHSDVTDDELRKRKRPRHEYDSTEQRDSTERRSYSPSSKHRRESRNYDRGSEAHISHRSRRREGEKDDEGHKQRKRNRSRSRSPRRTDHRRRSRSPKATDSRASDSKSSHKGKRRAEPQRTTVNDQEPKRTLPEVKLKQLRGEDRGSSTSKPPSRVVEETREDAVSDSGSDIGPYPEDHEKTLREYSSKMDKGEKSKLPLLGYSR
ncbi:hypothetical protein FRC14_002674 [Serendipita sp. 396]|nr:hypothetical protein FRC14_002674 [Serendipita sp. 396]